MYKYCVRYSSVSASRNERLTSESYTPICNSQSLYCRHNTKLRQNLFCSFGVKIPYFSIDNAHLMYNAHPKLMSSTSTLVLLLHLIYLSYLSNVYRACSFFTNLDLFCIDNARVIYRKIRYMKTEGPRRKYLHSFREICAKKAGP